MSPHVEEEEDGQYHNLRKRKNHHSVNWEDDSHDEPNGDELNDESLNVLPQKDGPYRNLRKRNRNPRFDPAVESGDEPNDGERNDESLEEVLFDIAKHAKRKTVLPKDIQLARCIKDRRQAC